MIERGHIMSMNSVQISGGPNKGLHLFDAKFKVDRLDVVMSVNRDDEDVRDAADERRGTFKRGDLYKMHTYRDAIPCARSVWILYPGTDTRFFNDLEKQTISSAESLPSIVQGVGAIPFLPDEEQHTAISSAIRHLCAQQPCLNQLLARSVCLRLSRRLRLLVISVLLLVISVLRQRSFVTRGSITSASITSSALTVGSLPCQ